ncbi:MULTISPECIES: hypothetical protein [Clostridium]|uniref:DUF4393 domain-containing protein n=1 Tax=Clostridium diolis TaxID=223919 RepID=A0AAV3VYZ0_9CLOT|nr:MULTISPECIES: hypothetical protein [Clostridium]ALB46002.1 hypothetical protein X276_12490 [Clostridium beijerinckii NRRL B-598]QES73915.1 hypothetical protein F3K33_14210 [Clostridium diolis]GEA31240.1 hypothetical protein CDIOL_21630 [Clostridium diolis]
MKTIDSYFKDELIKPSIKYGADISELAIDEILPNELLKKVPVVKTIIQMVEIGNYFQKRKLIKNISLFLCEYNSEKINQEKKKNFINKLQEKKYSGEVIDLLLDYFQKTRKDINTIMMSKVFIRYIEEEITFNQMEVIFYAIEHLSEKDMLTLINFYKNNSAGMGYIDTDDIDSYSICFGFNNLRNYHLMVISQDIDTNRSKIEAKYDEGYSRAPYAYEPKIVVDIREIGSLMEEGKILAQIAIDIL